MEMIICPNCKNTITDYYGKCAECGDVIHYDGCESPVDYAQCTCGEMYCKNHKDLVYSGSELCASCSAPCRVCEKIYKKEVFEKGCPENNGEAICPDCITNYCDKTECSECEY